jgi:dGTPase
MNLEENMYNHENNLSKFASLSKNAIRLKQEESDIRPAYFRDIDRIIYSLAYTRYIDKTQVFSLKENDHISKRIIHVQFVSKIAKTIGRALGLNEDLIEAIALGHDLGHVPFGHVGEKILNDISLKYDNTYFNHNAQSVRELMSLEKNGQGLNITIQVLDGILCHNGEFLSGKYIPKKKSVQTFLEDYNNTYINEKANAMLIPMTLEGCVVRISDIVGYIGRDIEDAIMLGILKKEELPKEITSVLGNNNREIINTIVTDIINNSLNKPYLLLSDDVYKALKALKNFNYKHIYDKANTKEQIEKYEEMFNFLFQFFLNDLENKNKDSIIYKDFLNNMNEEYKRKTKKPRIVIDYIAGMTDDYFIKQYNVCKKVEKNKNK